MTQVAWDKLDFHLTQVCNLNCPGCSHWSWKTAAAGHVEPAEFRETSRQWQARLRLQRLVLLGGEPGLHPQLSEMLQVARDIWVEPRISLWSNGTVFTQGPALLRQLAALRISLHITDHVGRDWHAEQQQAQAAGAELTVVREPNWAIFHRPDWLPAETPREQVAERCPCRGCIQLFRGQLWRCPIMAYANALPEPFYTAWQPYVQLHPALASTCTDAELMAWLRQAWRPGDYCTACPPQIPWRPRDSFRPSL